MSDKSSKTEKPTPRKRQKAREQGQVARSRDLTNVLGGAAAICVLVWGAPEAMHHWAGYYGRMLSLAVEEQSITTTSPFFYWTSIEIFRWAAPALLAGLAVSIAAGFAQGGLVFAPASLNFKIERLNPATKLGQMFSLTGLSGILKSLLPFGAILYVCVTLCTERWKTIVQASMLDFRSFAQLVTALTGELLWKSGLVLGVWAGVDYFLSWRKVEGDLRMSREEMKEEFKDTDGNPQIKARIRRIQRQVRRGQMVKNVESATVVVTNPTHFAVALKYEMDMDAPTVVAKGQNMVAQEIKEIARWNGIPMIENRPLAQALYRSAEVGFAIPAKLYVAVAEILALVYRARMQAQQAAAARNRAQGPNPRGAN